jgi:hypothetical protein
MAVGRRPDEGGSKLHFGISSDLLGLYKNINAWWRKLVNLSEEGVNQCGFG